MSLTSPRLTASLAAIACAALTIASCTEQMPTAPSAPGTLGVSTAAQPATEYWVTLFDTTPAPGAPAAPAPPPPSGSAPSPWPPGPPPRAQPGVPVPTPPSESLRLHIKIDPEPVPHSGVPVGTFSCRDHPYTWYYDQHLVTDTGVAVIFNARENFFDARYTSTNGEIIRIAGNSSVVLHTRWCSSFAKPHYTQTRFRGTDEYGEPIEISGPWVRLLAP